jgi:MFS family permease
LGFGTDSVTIVTGSILSEQCEDVARQKIFSIIQGAFTVGALIITFAYYLWKDWFVTVTFFLFIPVLITLFGFIYILKESPLYLIRDSPENALK